MYFDIIFKHMVLQYTLMYLNVSEHTMGNQKGLQSLFMMILVGN